MLEDIRKKERLIVRMHLFLDMIITIASFLSAYYLRKFVLPSGGIAGLNITPNYYIVLLLIIIIWIIVFALFNVYAGFSEKSYLEIVKDIIKTTSVGMIVVISVLFLFNMKEVSRLLLGIFYSTNTIFLLISKRLILVILRKYGQNRHNFHNILIVGSKRRAEGAIGLINSSRKGYNIIGCLDTHIDKVGLEVKDGVKIIGTMDDLKGIMLKHVIDEVIFAMPLKDIESVQVYMLLIEMIGVKVRIFPDWHIYSVLYQPGIAKIFFDDFHGIPTMLITATTSKHRDLLLKSFIDFSASAFGLLIISPLLILISLLIKIVSPGGKVLFSQQRLGLNGRTFNVYKFRTMVPNAEELLVQLKEKNEVDGPAFKIKKDPRIIPFIGTFLRKTSLDELPQFFNILKGEMSLVGPRPPIPSEVEQYDVWQRRRLSMKPGLTCLWQISPNRNDVSFNKWMEMDLQYIDNWSLWLDFEILWKTVKVVFAGEGR